MESTRLLLIEEKPGISTSLTEALEKSYQINIAKCLADGLNVSFRSQIWLVLCVIIDAGDEERKRIKKGIERFPRKTVFVLLGDTQNDKELLREGRVFQIVDRGVAPIVALKALENAHEKIKLGDDVSELEKTHETLRKLSRITEQSPASVVVTDINGTIEYVNPKFAQVTGYSPEEVIGNNPRVLNAGVQSREFYSDMWGTILDGKEWRGVLRNKKKNGDLYWERALISPLRNETGQLTHFIAVKEDITEQKRIAEELEKAKESAELANRAKSDFLARMSHEIRTPMNAIIGMNHLLRDTVLNQKQRKYADKMLNAAQTLLRIINDILDFSKIEAGKLELEEIDFELEDVLQNISAIVGLKAKEKGVEFVFDIDPDAPQFLIGDSLRLEQVLLNLTNNAVKFTETGEIVIRTELMNKTAEKVEIRFIVSDTGIGLTQTELAGLFQAFSQASAATTRQHGGTGLGLSICRRLVEMMGGSIEVASTKGKGSEFSFNVFLRYNREAESNQPKPTEVLNEIKTLVVDDNKMLRRAVKRTLDRMGLQVETVGSGEKAIETCLMAERGGRSFDLVIMDWNLPGMDGIEATKKIMAHPAVIHKPFIVMLTGYDTEEISAEAREAKVDGFLVKPMTGSSIFDSIVRLFGKQVQRRYRDNRLSQRPKLDLSSLANRRILLVEDNEINQQVAAELLRKEKIRVTIVDNGRQAVETVLHSEKKFDAVLMDIQMPEMDGCEATRLIRQDIRFKNLPIIAMTADATTSTKKKVYEVGMNTFVSKPIEPPVLFSALLKWMDQKNYRIKIVGTEIDLLKNAMDKEGTLYCPGVDTRSGLSHVGGNRSVYIQLLKKFATTRRNAVDEIRAAFTSGDINSAVRFVHTLKGVAANLGATEIQKSALQIEYALADGSIPKMDECLGELSKNLNIVINSIESLFSQAELSSVADTEVGLVNREVDMDRLLKTIGQLARQLEADDLDAVTTLRDLKNLLDKTKVAQDLKPIETHIEQYQYANALSALIQFSTKYQLPD